MYRIDVTPIIGVLLASVAAFVAAVIPEQQLSTTELNVPRCLDSHCGLEEPPYALTPYLGNPLVDSLPPVRYLAFAPSTSWGDVIAKMDAIRADHPGLLIALDPAQQQRGLTEAP